MPQTSMFLTTLRHFGHALVGLLLALSISGTAHAAVVRVVDFEDGVTGSAGNHPHLNPSGNAPEVVTAQDGVRPRSGTYMMRTYLNRETSATNFRTEVTLTSPSEFEKGKEYWVGLSVFLPEDWRMDYGSKASDGIVWQFHCRGYQDLENWRGILPLTLMHSENGWVLRNHYFPTKEPTATVGLGNLQRIWKEFPYKLGQWTDFVMHVKFSGAQSPDDTNGFLRVWVDGEQVLDQSGQNYFGEQTVGPYFKFGLYNSAWKYVDTWQGPSSRVLYHDELRIGDHSSSYSEVAPGADPTDPPPPSCVDNDGDGYGSGQACLGSDCDDTSSTIHPGAAELCDNMDTNCDGVLDPDSCEPDPCDPNTGEGCVEGGLLAHWSFDEGRGSTTADLSGNGYDGSMENAEWTTGIWGTAAQFDGTSSYVDVSGVTPRGEELTVALWMRADSFAVSDARLISKANGVQTADHDFMISTFDDGESLKPRVRLQTSHAAVTLIGSGPNLVTDTWIHLAFVYNGSDLAIYQDGTVVASMPLSGAVANTAAHTWLGLNPDGSRPFSGAIDDVRLYGAALTAVELGAIISGVGLEPECVADDDCDDGNDCTTESCDAGVCSSAENAECAPAEDEPLPDGTCEIDEDCQDGDSCTYDVCNEGRCISAVISDCAEEGQIVVGCMQTGGGAWPGMLSVLAVAFWRRRRSSRSSTEA